MNCSNLLFLLVLRQRMWWSGYTVSWCLWLMMSLVLKAASPSWDERGLQAPSREDASLIGLPPPWDLQRGVGFYLLYGRALRLNLLECHLRTLNLLVYIVKFIQSSCIYQCKVIVSQNVILSEHISTLIPDVFKVAIVFFSQFCNQSQKEEANLL